MAVNSKSPVLPEKKWLLTDEAAAYSGFAGATLKKWRAQGTGPVYRKVGRCVRYSVADLNAFMASGLERGGK